MKGRVENGIGIEIEVGNEVLIGAEETKVAGDWVRSSCPSPLAGWETGEIRGTIWVAIT